MQNNYTYGGDYKINITTNYTNGSDYETRNSKFGVRATSIAILDKNVSKRLFEFKYESDVAELLPNVSWNCSENINSTYGANLTGTIIDYIQHNYTSTGQKTFTCLAKGQDGNESKSITFNVEGLEVKHYDILSTNISRRIIGCIV